jgi:transcriptional regulator GlxA family with amidase domain
VSRPPAGRHRRKAPPTSVDNIIEIPSDYRARRINLSERPFSRLFKAEVSSTPAGHVEALRLEAACRLLETTQSPVEQIAKTCGFGTPETMNLTFRRRLNTTPGNHRRHFGSLS